MPRTAYLEIDLVLPLEQDLAIIHQTRSEHRPIGRKKGLRLKTGCMSRSHPFGAGKRGERRCHEIALTRLARLQVVVVARLSAPCQPQM